MPIRGRCGSSCSARCARGAVSGNSSSAGRGGGRCSGMLAHARQAVSRGALIDGLWGSEPPASAENSVHVYIAGLRRVLEPRRAPRAPSQFLLAAAGDGYRLRLAPGTLDTEVLGQRIADARRLVAEDPAAAARALDAALGLWQGASLAGVPGSWAEIERARLDELRQTAIADRIDIMLTLGGHHQALAELAALIRQHPLQERFYGQLMLALYRCGRQADALAAFARRSPGARRPAWHRPGAAAAAVAPADPHRRRRTRPRRRLSGPLAGRGCRGSCPRTWTSSSAGQRNWPNSTGCSPPEPRLICVLAGTAGVGKTALAVHWGHRVRDAFPGGQLYCRPPRPRPTRAGDRGRRARRLPARARRRGPGHPR